MGDYIYNLYILYNIYLEKLYKKKLKIVIQFDIIIFIQIYRHTLIYI